MDPELYNAAINGSYKSFSKKIRLGVNLNLQLTSRENSLLHVAAKSGKKKIAEVILNNSQRELMYEKNSEGNTALHIAASLGHLEMTQLLIDRAKPKGVEVYNELQEVEVHIELQGVEAQNELQGVEGQNELQRVEAQNELLRMVNLDEDTPVHVAVKNGHYKIVTTLIFLRNYILHV